MDLKNKRILITGGSAGIGKAIIKELVQRGANNMAIFGRKKAPMENLEKEFDSANFLLIQGDVSRHEDLDKGIALITRAWGGLDILINNAGVVSAGPLSDISDDDITQQINVNLTGLILLTKKSLPLLKNSSEGAIMNMSSGYGYIAMPFYSVYAATKAAVRQFSDALRRELHKYPLHVLTVYPSATDTNMMKTAKVGAMDSPEEVARLAIDGLISKEINIIVGGEEKKQQVNLNFTHPRKMDQIAIENYENLEKRTRKHRSM